MTGRHDISAAADPVGLLGLVDHDTVRAAENTMTTETVFRPVWPEIDGTGGFADDPIVEPRQPGEFACRGCFLIKLDCQHVGDGYCVDCVADAGIGAFG